MEHFSSPLSADRGETLKAQFEARLLKEVTSARE
jgi:hypothetical protein